MPINQRFPILKVTRLNNSPSNIDYYTIKQIYSENTSTGAKYFLIRDSLETNFEKRPYQPNPQNRSSSKSTWQVRKVFTYKGHIDVESSSANLIRPSDPGYILTNAWFFKEIHEDVIRSSSTGATTLNSQVITAPTRTFTKYMFIQTLYNLERNYWEIKNISIRDNNNGTSTVSVYLIAYSDWCDMGTVIVDTKGNDGDTDGSLSNYNLNGTFYVGS